MIVGDCVRAIPLNTFDRVIHKTGEMLIRLFSWIDGWIHTSGHGLFYTGCSVKFKSVIKVIQFKEKGSLPCYVALSISSRRVLYHSLCTGIAILIFGKLPEGSSKINRYSLNRCPPYTEIFSKRRKIYSVCVESLRIRFCHL